MATSGDIVIREARPDDCESILEMIKALAEFENNQTAIKVDADKLRRDWFGPDKCFHCIVAADKKDDRVLLGYAVYVFHYYTLDGIYVFLEDLYVRQTYRKCGVGSRLLQEVAKVAVDRGCKRLDLICFSWNKQAVDFYKSKGAVNRTETEGTHYYRLQGKELTEFARKS